MEAVAVGNERRTYSTSLRERSRDWHFEVEEGMIWHDEDRHWRDQQTEKLV